MTAFQQVAPVCIYTLSLGVLTCQSPKAISHIAPTFSCLCIFIFIQLTELNVMIKVIYVEENIAHLDNKPIKGNWQGSEVWGGAWLGCFCPTPFSCHPLGFSMFCCCTICHHCKSCCQTDTHQTSPRPGWSNWLPHISFSIVRKNVKLSLKQKQLTWGVWLWFTPWGRSHPEHWTCLLHVTLNE